MSQMCPNCSHDNPDDATTCTNCQLTLRGLLGEDTVLSNRYQVTSVLGSGAMGAVYLANDQRLAGRRCAIKENRVDPNVGPEIQKELREQFLAEARVMARLDHAVLPKVSDYFIENDREYLVMDYVEGEDLQSLLERNGQPLPEDRVLLWAYQVLDAMAYLHNQIPQPIIHRDIKPSNLRVNTQDKVKLVDFGLVKLLDLKKPETKVELRGIGTPAYAPLEQFAGSDEHTDARSDIYALGATLYHLLTNLYPPGAHERVLNPDILTPPRQLNPILSENTERVIMRALEIRPDQRFQTAEEMRQALAGLSKSTAFPVSNQNVAPIAVEDIPEPRRRIAPWVFGLIGLLAVLLILGGLAYFLFTLFPSRAAQESSQEGAVSEVESPTATPTELILQSLSDVPTDTPTLVIQDMDSPTETPTPGELPTETPTPTPEPTDTPTTGSATEPVQGLPAASLVGTIAYPVFNGTDYDIYLGQADGSGTQFYRAQASQPAFSKDGTKLAFHSWRLDQRGLVVMDVDGGNEYMITNFVEDQLPTWSNNNTEMILLSRRTGDRRSQLIRVVELNRVTVGTVLAEGEYPYEGLTGQLVFKGWGKTEPGLRLSSTDLENIQPITDSNDDTAPALSPDGERIVFMSRRSGNWEIYLVNVDGSDPQRLTDDPAEDGLPTWSPDGQVIAFVSNRGGNWAVWAMTPDGQNQEQLFPMEGSPDGFVGTDTFASRGWAEERISWTR